MEVKKEKRKRLQYKRSEKLIDPVAVAGCIFCAKKMFDNILLYDGDRWIAFCIDLEAC